MTSKRVTIKRSVVEVDPETGLSAQQEHAAEMLADGTVRRIVAEVVGCDQGTLWRWCQDERFIAYAIAQREALRQTRMAEREARIRDALRIDREVLAGRLAHDDPRARRAAEILRDTEDRVYGGVDSGSPVGSRPRPKAIIDGGDTG